MQGWLGQLPALLSFLLYLLRARPASSLEAPGKGWHPGGQVLLFSNSRSPPWLTPRLVAPDLSLFPLLPTPRKTSNQFLVSVSLHLTQTGAKWLVHPLLPKGIIRVFFRHPSVTLAVCRMKPSSLLGPLSSRLVSSDSTAHPHSVDSCLEGLLFARHCYPR